MQFKLTNMGRIGTADVMLNGITVIAGPNGSGKSTISRALFTWFNYLRNLEKDIPIERANSIREDIRDVLVKGGMSPYLASRFLPIYFRGRPPKKFIDKSFWQDEKASKEWLIERRIRTPWQRNPTDGDMSWINQIYEQIRSCALSRIDTDDAKLGRFIFEQYFLRAFDGQVGSLFDRDAMSVISLANDDNIVQSGSFSGDKVASLENVGIQNGYLDNYGGLRMFYLEPCHLMDEMTKTGRTVRQLFADRYTIEDALTWKSILNRDLNPAEITFPQKERLARIGDELDKIVSTIHGEIVRDETKLAFKDADLPGDKTVSLMNIASGAKSMAAIVRGLRNDSIHPGDFIIIDEPESNLHPEWQVRFAKFLVLLHAKFGIRFLLNTHSPEFLKAIEVYSDLLEQQSDCSYYNMVSETGWQYNTKCVNENRDEIFRSMGKPFISLMHGEGYEQTIS